MCSLSVNNGVEARINKDRNLYPENIQFSKLKLLARGSADVSAIGRLP